MPIQAKRENRKITHSIYTPSETLHNSITNTVTEMLCFGYLVASVEGGKSIEASINDFINQFNVTCKKPSELRNKYYSMMKLKANNELVL
jgi:hypothetical protein